jgi:L-ornithine N5-oxygenase
MGISEYEEYDVVGIGFGPSNLSLAIALEEHRASFPERPVAATFFERQPAFGWHRDMLLPSATMQVAFLKDLATFRNPTSRFTFVSYLHESGRLAQFTNNLDFFPTRQEFHRYLEWAESKLTGLVSYDSKVTAIRPAAGSGPVDSLRIEIRTGGGTRTVTTRNVSISTGLVPRIPDDVELDDRIWHSSEFLTKFRRVNPDDLTSVAVVGAGQSAAEITRYFHESIPHAQIYSVIPSYGYSVADATPFANQVFDPAAVDDYYFGTDQTRQAFWNYHRNTNYSVVDDDLLKDLYRRLYDEDVRGSRRLHFRNLTRLGTVKRAGGVVRLALHSLLDGDCQELCVDAVVLATGYDAMEPSALLRDLDRYCMRDKLGQLRVQRDYRIVTTPELRCAIYLQGGTEHTHGLSASLLSNIAVRSGEIADSIIRRSAEVSAGIG